MAGRIRTISVGHQHRTERRQLPDFGYDDFFIKYVCKELTEIRVFSGDHPAVSDRLLANALVMLPIADTGTSDDVVFQADDIMRNEDLVRGKWTHGGETVQINKIDDTHFTFVFAALNPVYRNYLVTNGSYFTPWAASHVLKQYQRQMQTPLLPGMATGR